MRTPPLLADFSHARPCKPFCENSLTLPCEACRYTFVSGEDLIQCPDCGKPQVRKPTEKEIADYIRIRMEIEKENMGQ